MLITKEKAWSILLENGISAPLTFDDLRRICKKRGWGLESYQGGASLINSLSLCEIADKFPAFTFRWNDGTTIIFYRDSLSTADRIQTIAHEIGHITLEHLYSGVAGYSELERPQETEANEFAYELILPSCVVTKCGWRDANDIRHMADMTATCVNYHTATSNSDAYDPPTRGKVIDQYSAYVQSHRKDNQLFYKALCFTVVFLAGIVLGILLARPDLIGIGDPPIYPTTTQAPITKSTNDKVFIINGGECYHAYGCKYTDIEKYLVQVVTRQEAVDMGRQACQLCNP